MLRFLPKKPGLGIEITSSAMRLTVVSDRQADRPALFSRTTALSTGVVEESYAVPNITDLDRLSDLVRQSIADISHPVTRRVALSLPDSLFRVQIIEFDSLPAKAADQERLVRWRLEKTACDMSDTVLRYQIFPRQGDGVSVLACLAKQAVISQYESLLAQQGLEPWSVGPSSFHALNFYSSYITSKTALFALAHISKGSFAIIITEAGAVRFYRYKDIPRGSADESTARLLREIEDSLHFYTHRDRTQQVEVKSLYLTGESPLTAGLIEGLRSGTSLDVEVLTPSVVFGSADKAGREFASALGAGCSL